MKKIATNPIVLMSHIFSFRNNILRLIFFSAFFTLIHICSSASALAATHPNMYLNQAEINAIKQKIDSGAEPWKEAFKKLQADADKALDLSIQSVTKQGGSFGHVYEIDSPYSWSNNMANSPCGRNRCDGQINPKANRDDYVAAIKIGGAVRDLGLAYVFTGSSKYADKAIQLINGWAVEPSTAMVPKFPQLNTNITLSITMPGLFYGADLIWNYTGWEPSQKSAFLSWVRKFIDSGKSWTLKNNIEDWRMVFLSSAASLVEDQETMHFAFEKWKSLLGASIDANGFLPLETHRTKGIDYSVYAINAKLQTAEIARHQGIDLYRHSVNCRSLERALDTHVRYVIGTKSWPYKQIGGYHGKNAAVYELAYSHYKKREYLDVIKKWGRPMQEKRIMGPITLTHANLFSLGLMSDKVAAVHGEAKNPECNIKKSALDKIIDRFAPGFDFFDDAE